MGKYRYSGDEPRVFCTIADPDGNGTWIAEPGDEIDLNPDPDPVPDGLEPVTAKKTASKSTPDETKE